MNPRTDLDEDINGLKNLDIDQIMQRKKQQALELKERQEKVQDNIKQTHQPLEDFIDTSLNQLLNQSQPADEIDFIV